jgi:hypothetical protein
VPSRIDSEEGKRVAIHAGRHHVTTQPAARRSIQTQHIAVLQVACYYPQPTVPSDFHGLFRYDSSIDGRRRVLRGALPPTTIPCPTTGRQLRVATIDANTSAICPACATHGHGGYVSFDGDLRMAYACPECGQFVWLQGV